MCKDYQSFLNKMSVSFLVFLLEMYELLILVTLIQVECPRRLFL